MPWSTVLKYDMENMLGIAHKGTDSILAGQINILVVLTICQWRGEIVARSYRDMDLPKACKNGYYEIQRNNGSYPVATSEW